MALCTFLELSLVPNVILWNGKWFFSRWSHYQIISFTNAFRRSHHGTHIEQASSPQKSSSDMLVISYKLFCSKNCEENCQLFSATILLRKWPFQGHLQVDRKGGQILRKWFDSKGLLGSHCLKYFPAGFYSFNQCQNSTIKRQFRGLRDYSTKFRILGSVSKGTVWSMAESMRPYRQYKRQAYYQWSTPPEIALYKIFLSIFYFFSKIF